MKELGRINQIGYVVPDVEAAAEYWVEAFGVGPWAIQQGLKAENFIYRGKASTMIMDVAVANSEDVQIELIQDKSPDPNFYSEFVKAGHMGINHIAFWQEPEKYDLACEHLRSKGWKVVQQGEFGGSVGRFSYYEHEKAPGTVIELSSCGGEKAVQFGLVRDFAKNWDGDLPFLYL